MKFECLCDELMIGDSSIACQIAESRPKGLVHHHNQGSSENRVFISVWPFYSPQIASRGYVIRIGIVFADGQMRSSEVCPFLVRKQKVRLHLKSKGRSISVRTGLSSQPTKLNLSDRVALCQYEADLGCQLSAAGDAKITDSARTDIHCRICELFQLGSNSA